MRKFVLLVIAGLLAGSCDPPARKSGWFIGGKDRRIVDVPPPEALPPQPVAAPAPGDPATAGRADGPAPGPSGGPEVPESAAAEGVPARPDQVIGSGRFISEDPAPVQQPVIRSDGTVTLNFVDADIRDVVRTVLGGTLGRNFAVDPSVKGTITLQTSRPIPRGDVIAVLESALRLNGLAMVQSGSLFRVLPAAAAARQGGRPHITGLTGRRGEGFGVEIMPLKFAAVTEMARILQPIVPPEAILRTDPARNLLMVSGTRQERQTIEEIVALFDVDWLSGMSFAIVPLAHAQSKDTISDLERVFGAAKGGPLDGLVRFFPVERRNAVLVISTQPDYVEQAKSWIGRLDVGGADQKRLYVYSVENARATDLAAILGQIFSDSPAAPALRSGTTVPGRQRARLSTSGLGDPAGSPQPTSGLQSPTVSAQTLGPPLTAAQATAPPPAAAPPAGSEPGEAAAGGDLPEEMTARIIPDDTNNSLVVMARPRVWQMIQEALRKLDVVPLQVLIEATVTEVTLNDDLRYGVQAFFNSGGSQIAFSTGATAAINATFPGFSYVFRNSDGTIQSILDALDSVTDIRVISTPQVLVLDNRTAELQVGDQVPISTQQSISNTDPNAPTVNQIEFRNTGVVLRVTPRVNASGVVNLEIEQEESSAIQTTSSGIDSPTIQQRRLRSTVVVNSGETIALGGLIRDTQTDTVSGIPLLSAIPIVGRLFASTTETGRRTELLVLIRPRVVRNQEEARSVTRELRETLRNAAALYRPQRAPTP